MRFQFTPILSFSVLPLKLKNDAEVCLKDALFLRELRKDLYLLCNPFALSRSQ